MLIVEDEFIVANNLKIILQQAGYSVVGIAASVTDANSLIAGNKVDIVLLDIHLKGKLTGIDLAHQLKEKHIPFVYLSANSDRNILDQAKITEPYGFLVKPYREKDVLIALEIARYRHKQNIEFRTWQEDLLQKQLNTILTGSLPSVSLVNELLKVLQVYLPFDFLSIHELSVEHISYNAFLRIGYEEYQHIGIDELSMITHLPVEKVKILLDKAIQNGSGDVALTVDITKEKDVSEIRLLYQLHLQMLSEIRLPLLLHDKRHFCISFYSKKAAAFDAAHLALVVKLQYQLSQMVQALHPGIQGVADARKRKVNDQRKPFSGIIGNSSEWLGVLDMVQQVAPLDTSVLLLGESGTGKERIASSIHNLSSRRDGAFIKINCATLPQNLIESELFGHEKGAFTGAVDKKAGKFELADRGTIFLDEIGELPLEQQSKLLRVLQEKEIERVGGTKPVKIDVRVIAATNRNLEKEIAEGRFRLDLYYRLNVFPIELPALRDRLADIKILAYHFAGSIAEKMNKNFYGISEAMLQQLEQYDWPGNVRELENVIEQSVILSDDGMPLSLRRPLTGYKTQTSTAQAQSLDDVKALQLQAEKNFIINALRKTKGRIRGAEGAAVMLNQKPTTLESRMLRLGIRKEDFQ
ncbi:MAG: sigma 54-interacting transcriptional regulator [Bacteroidetes bacterium]|nr:sigma 54-interacting transcriptional regulator [Bacteroidota bacterium]